MICPYCKANLPEGAKACPCCGAQFAANNPYYQQAPGMYPPIMPVQSKYCGKAIAAFVLSLVGILIAGIICGILGIIFASIALYEINQKPYLQGKGLAIAGLIISILDCVLMFLLIGVAL